MQRFGTCVVVVGFCALSKACVGSGTSGSDNEQVLRKELAYLSDVNEVAWVEFDDNDVYIGFAARPSDLGAVVNAAAVNGNRAIDFGVHVWAVSADRRGWRPGSGPYYCEATARYGKLENACR